jgi:hypothetical protein
MTDQELPSEGSFRDLIPAVGKRMPGRPMLVLAEERRREIVKIARKEGRVSIGKSHSAL